MSCLSVCLNSLIEQCSVPLGVIGRPASSATRALPCIQACSCCAAQRMHPPIRPPNRCRRPPAHAPAHPPSPICSILAPGNPTVCRVLPYVGQYVTCYAETGSMCQQPVQASFGRLGRRRLCGNSSKFERGGQQAAALCGSGNRKLPEVESLMQQQEAAASRGEHACMRLDATCGP